MFDYDLPDETYKVVASWGNNKYYANRKNVKLAVWQRKRYGSKDVRVFRGRIVWEDVTEEFIDD